MKWQSSFESKEECFVVELRHALKFIIVSLYELVQKVSATLSVYILVITYEQVLIEYFGLLRLIYLD